jgi:rhodanese-related sulfurtransferase
MKPYYLLIVAFALALAPFRTSAEDRKALADKPAHKNVNADEFERLSKEPDTVILDVRSPKEYAAGHIKNSVLIDFNARDFDEKVKQLDKSKTYLVHCAVGGRSAKACSKMDGFDFPKVVNLEGGIKAWEKAGKPVEK